MSREMQLAVKTFKQGLADIYGSRLRGVYVFGSEARGEATSDSDLDVAIVLDRLTRYSEELERTGALASRISLSTGRTLSRVFLEEEVWKHGQTSFLASIRGDALQA